MHTVKAQVVIEDACRMIGWDLGQMEARQDQMARQALSMALQEVWEAWWWQVLMVAAEVAGAEVYTTSLAVTAGEFYYFPGTQKYYQALRTTSGHAPATYSAGSWTTNYAYWAEAVEEFEASDYDATATYELGDVVRCAEDGEYYQLFSTAAGLLVSGAGMVGANGVYSPVTVGNYVQQLDSSYTILNTVGLAISISYLGTELYVSNHFGAVNPMVVSAGGTAPAPTATAVLNTYTSPPAAAYWARLYPFTAAIEISGEVRAVAEEDPRDSNNSGQADWEKTLDGIRVPGWTDGKMWVWYRRPTPILTGDDYDATATYEATAAADLSF